MSKPDTPAKPGAPAPTDREARLAEALRANLRRRKGAARKADDASSSQ